MGVRHTRVFGVAVSSDRYPGAASLVCLSAVASGLGMVQYAGPVRFRDHVLSAFSGFVASLGTEGQAQAWMAGSGLDCSNNARSRLMEVIEACRADALPLVLDASAIDLIVLNDLRRLWKVEVPIILTPHQDELPRLTERLSIPVVRTWECATALAAARAAAQALDAVVLLKGLATVYVAPNGRAIVQNGGPELATADTGDCLAGLVGSVLAPCGAWHSDQTGGEGCRGGMATRGRGCSGS